MLPHGTRHGHVHGTLRKQSALYRRGKAQNTKYHGHNKMKIHFKTKEPFFSKEEDGYKCCTVRSVGDGDMRFDDLMEIIQADDYGARKDVIVITDPNTGDSFERRITDVSYFDERFIISWQHKR